VQLSTLVRNALVMEGEEDFDTEKGRGRLLYRHGQDDWFRGLRPAPTLSEEAREGPETAIASAGRTRLERQTPSGEEEELTGASFLFSPAARRAADLGTAVHELFELVEWSHDAEPDHIVERLKERQRPDDTVFEQAAEQFKSAVVHAAIARALARPEGPCRLWREKNFEVVLEDHWVTGTFDRVVLVGEDGAWDRAVITDYKTSRIDRPGDLERAQRTYAPQMKLYRKVLSALTGLDGANIELRLIFTRTGLVERII